jgi:tetratricopeptide (TPR) repeat protein
VKLARRAIELKPDCENGYVVLGRALFESDRWKEAAEIVDRAVATAGDDYNIYIPFGNSLRALGKMDAANALAEKQREALERRLENVPEDVRARSLLAASYARAGKIDEAVTQTVNAVTMRPDDSLTLYNAACTYGILNMKHEALAMFAKCIEAGWRNPEWAARDRDLACIHDNADFQRLIKDSVLKH